MNELQGAALIFTLWVIAGGVWAIAFHLASLREDLKK